MANMKLALLLVALAVPTAVFCKPVEQSTQQPTSAAPSKQPTTTGSKSGQATTAASQQDSGTTAAGSTDIGTTNQPGHTGSQAAGSTSLPDTSTKVSGELNSSQKDAAELTKTTKTQESPVTSISTNPPKLSSTESPNEPSTTNGVRIEASTTTVKA